MSNLAIDRFFEDFNDVFSRGSLLAPAFLKPLTARKPVTVSNGIQSSRDTEAGTFSVSFDVPGVSKADITADLNTETGVLTVSAKSETRQTEYRVQLPVDVDAAGDVTDKFQNGVLTFTFNTATPEEVSPVRKLLTTES